MITKKHTLEVIKLLLRHENLISSERFRQAGLYKEFEEWKSSHNYDPDSAFRTRFDMYDCLLNDIGDSPIDFLEFGVWRGESIKFWAKGVTSPASRFVGFDSFEGLPADWYDMPKGNFDTGGNVPRVNDDRIEFVSGWFQDVLPSFLENFRPRNPLVVHFDADLYTSTLFTITSLNSVIVPNSILVFDEFNVLAHEFRAFLDYAQSYSRKYEVLAYTQDCDQVAIRITA